jgi:hypothetical protein
MSEPYCVAMVLADAVHIDPGTHKRFILGTFSTLASHSFPATLNLSVFYGLTDADQGDFEVTFRIVDSKHLFDDDSKPIFLATIPISSPSPLAVCEGVLTLQGLVIPAAGVYHCELLHRNEVLMARRLIAIETQSTEQR